MKEKHKLLNYVKLIKFISSKSHLLQKKPRLKLLLQHAALLRYHDRKELGTLNNSIKQLLRRHTRDF